ARYNAITLNLTHATNLDSAITRWFNTWVEEAPEDYICDNFLTHHIPVAITSLYGQNQPLPVNQNDDSEELENWSRNRDFTRIKYISFSLATHIDVRQVTSWHNRPLDNIRDMYGDEYFDNYDPHNRNPISFHDLQDLPLLDASGSEIPIFTDEGYPIKRRFGSRLAGTPPLAVLMNLRNLDQLFISDDLFGDFDPSDGPTTFHVYPQAGLVTAGHFQADGLPSAFAPLLHTLNLDVKLQDQVSIEDDPLADSR
ncbi:hypothetical protein AX14_011298, partial [Amanita brunnescens Koide BX004]